MTIVEAKNATNPHRVRCFTHNVLVESIAKQQWDLVKIFCTQPFNNKLKYGLSFVTLHTPEEMKGDGSPVKPIEVAQKSSSGVVDDKKNKFGKFSLRPDSDSDDDKKKAKKVELTSPFDRWKSSKGSQDKATSIKDQVKTKIEENRKRIRLMSDSSDDATTKPITKQKPNRNRTAGLVYEDDDDEPNEKLQKKLDKDRERKDKEQRTPKQLTKRDKSPSDSGKSKFASFISGDASTSSKRDKSPAPTKRSPANSSSKRDKSPARSSSKRDRSPASSPSKRNKSPSRSSSRRDKSPAQSSSSSSHNRPSFASSSKKPSPKKSPRTEKKSSSSSTSKPFNKLLDGVIFAFSGYVNPERGILRQKALDMGAKYKPDWDRNCTHLM